MSSAHEMSDAEIDAWIAAMTTVNGLPMPEACRPGARANLRVAARLAELVLDFPLPDEIDPAPIFKA